MSPLLLEGKAPADAILQSLEPAVRSVDPKLVMVQVGDDAASGSYIRSKLKACERIGMRVEHRKLPEGTGLASLLGTIEELNADDDVSAFIVQSPLPGVLQESFPEVMRAIDPKKDADGFTAYNLGKMFLSPEFEHLPPATPAGVLEMLSHYQIGVPGKEVVIVGRGPFVGRPLGIMLLNRSATVTMCHSKTPDIAAHTVRADILISAVGKANLITKDMVKPGAVVIDIGIDHDGEKMVGDVDFAAVSAVASAITPVPGGVGPLTVACLLRNCVRARERR